MILPSQNLIFSDQKILPNSEYASPPSLNPLKSEGGQVQFPNQIQFPKGSPRHRPPELPSEIPADLLAHPNGREHPLMKFSPSSLLPSQPTFLRRLDVHDPLRGEIPSPDGNQTSEGHRDQYNEPTDQSPLPRSLPQNKENPYGI